MTPYQFEVLAKLLRSKDPTKKAARLVLIDGNAPMEAARKAKTTPQGVSNSIKRYREADQLIRSAYTMEEKGTDEEK